MEEQYKESKTPATDFILGKIEQEAPEWMFEEGGVSSLSSKVFHKPTSRNELIRALLNLGYRSYPVTQSQWRAAYVASSEQQTFYILVRKNGVDFRVFEKSNYFDWQGGRLRVSDGVGPDNFYHRSETGLHVHVMAAALDFLSTGRLSQAFMKPVGVSFRNSPEFEEYKKMKASSRKESSNTDVYSSLGSDGEAIYMGDGMWLNADDSYTDRGR